MEENSYELTGLEFLCTGHGCKGYGCGSLLYVEAGDLKLYYKNRINYYLVCPVCNSVNFVEEYKIPRVLKRFALESIRYR